MAADDSTAAKTEKNQHHHPLMYLHANSSNSATANNTAAHVKREMKATNLLDDARDENDNKDNIKMVNSNESSSSRLISIKSITITIILLLVVTSLHSMLQTYDNKIATSAILLHHCHSFMITFASTAFKLLYAIKDIILFLVASSSSIISSSSSSSSSSNSNNAGMMMVMEQFQSRLQKGQQLLSQYKDISGSEMVCKSVANAVVITVNERRRNKRGGSDDDDDTTSSSQDYVNDNNDDDTTTTTTLPLSYSSIISLQLTQDESNLLSKSLSCVAEANLNLFQQQQQQHHQQQQQLEYLRIAKSYLDNALVIDPTDPLIRANIGLTYLLLGTSSSSYITTTLSSLDDDDGDDDESSVQFVLQSIQHLNVAIGILKSNNNEHNNDDESSSSSEAVYMAALHNLGLANLALDGLFDDGGGDDHYYLEWIDAFKSSEEEEEYPSILKSSGLFLVNEGASLLQNRRVDDAIVGLTSFVNEFCTSVNDASEGTTKKKKKKKKKKGTKREREVCLVARHNLAIAEGDGADLGDKIDVTTLVERIITNDVPQITDIAIEEIPRVEVEGDVESVETGDVDENVGDYPDSSNTTDIPNDDDDDGKSHDDLNSTHIDAQQEEEQEEQEKAPDTANDVVEVDTPTPQVKTEMQNALVALEKAAESTQRCRLLLALAKARVSAGDFSGAVDAALKAISAAKSEEEAEISTSYLETLMDRIADEESGVVRAVAEDLSTRHDVRKEGSTVSEDQLKQRHTSLIGEGDLSITELQFKLELERLKYKVLEQEMRFAQHQVWNHPRNEFNAKNVKAIDYKQNVNHVRDEIRPSPSYQDKVESQNAAAKDDEHDKRVGPEESDAPDISIQNITSVEEENDSDHVNITENTKDVDTSDLNDASGGNATTDENQSHEEQQQSETEVEDEVIKTYGNDPDIIDFDEETSVVKGEEKVVDEEVPDAPVAEEETHVVVKEEKIELPSLFSPAHIPPTELMAHAKSYMKMADAYLDKGQYQMASKQFLKVIKKAPDHLPAHLGYATALERDGKSKQISAVALAYGNATRVAIAQGEQVDPLVKAGGGRIAENILRRALKIAKAAPSQRFETLRVLSTHAHTAALAADIYYEIGMELASSDVSSAKEAFAISNEFITTRNDDASRFHIGSIIELGRLALEGDNDANKAIEYLNKAKDAHMEDGDHVKLLVLVGRAHMSLGEIEVAISELTRALSLPESPDTQNAHYELAIALSKNNADKHEVDLHFEKALDMGMDPTAEAIEALGERNMSVMRALNRQYYRQFNNQADRSEGGILSGRGLGSQSSSLFASKQASEDDSAQSDPLSLLEQGASAYDANNVMGGAVEAESNLSNLSNRQAK